MPQLSSGHVFMSYSRRDDVVMRRVVSFLRKQGIKVWVDNERLTPGTPIWEEEIEKAIKGASAIVVVLSPDSKGSEWVRREISLADQYRKRVFPVLVGGDEETSITLRLINRQFVDIRENEDVGLGSLETALSIYLQELSTQEEKAKIEVQRLAREKARQEAAEKAEREIKEGIEKEKVRHEANEKALREKERLNAARTAKNELAEQRFAKSVAFVSQIKQRLTTLPKSIITGFVGLVLVILVVWGTTFRASQVEKDNLGAINITATETLNSQSTTETAASITTTETPTFQPTITLTVEGAPSTLIDITPTNSPQVIAGPIPGISVSRWDAEIDWPKVRSVGIRFVFIKASEGISYIDDTFSDNWIGSKSVGILRGPYHFFRANVDPTKQAEYFIQTVKAMDDNGELPPVLDLETNDGVSKEIIIPNVKIWLDLVEQGLGRKPIIYSGQYFLQDYLSETGGGPPEWMNDYPLWLAQYPNQYVQGMEPFLPSGWFNWTFWEYSDKGKVNGINASVYMEFFNGSLEDLYQFSGNP